MKFLILILFLVSCATSQVTNSGNVPTFPKATIGFSVDNVPKLGTALLEKQKSYSLNVTVPSETLKLYFSTCHRSFEVTGFNNKGEVWKYAYWPISDLEAQGSCLASIMMIDSNAKTSLAYIDFKDDGTLDMSGWCSGNFAISKGALFCQARAGLTQNVIFDESVKFVASKNCAELIESKTVNTFEYQISEGLCIYTVKGASGKMGRLTTYGFNK